MLRRKRFKPLSIAVTFSVLFLTGCASISPTVKPPDSEFTRQRAETPEEGWWYARFHMDWAQDQDPSWHMDLFLAHEVVAPVLKRYRSQIPLWRFHRRAARDQAGHQFSFIFYSTPQTAQRVYAALRSDPRLKKMKSSGVIVRDIYDDTDRVTRHNVEDTSDGNWSPLVQKSWPYFIMGVSEMWLDLIAQVAESASQEKKPLSPREIGAFYQQVDHSVKQLWQEQGNHAFLHHLNAIFGYEPLVVYERRLMRF